MSTLSPNSSLEENMASPQCSQLTVPKLKRAKPSEFPVLVKKKKVKKKAKHSLLGEDFTLPISSKIKQCVEDNIPLNDASRRQLIRDCVNCLKAYVDHKQLTSGDFTEVAKQLCDRKPVLHNERHLNCPDDIEFLYWVT